MKRLLLLFALFTLLAVPAMAQTAETPDECAARLDIDIRVGSIAAAYDWIAQVERECIQDEGAGEGMLRLELLEGVTLPNTNCLVILNELQGQDEVNIYPRVWRSSIKLHHRAGLAGDWTAMQAGVARVLEGGGIEAQFTPYHLPGETLITGAGLHQFEVRTRKGADKFEIMETWGAFYALEIMDC